MPLQNRVSPFGDLFASAARGTLMGNRGGRIHTAARSLTARRWASKQWICCRLDFKNRHRRVWGDGYTELFFLDEVTALAAGHRPCFECRRADAVAFARCWPADRSPRAPEMDNLLHAERLNGRAKALHRMRADKLTDGVMFAQEDAAFTRRNGMLLRWTPSGYSQSSATVSQFVAVLTPASIVAVLKAGYAPHWHASAAQVV